MRGHELDGVQVFLYTAVPAKKFKLPRFLSLHLLGPWREKPSLSYRPGVPLLYFLTPSKGSRSRPPASLYLVQTCTHFGRDEADMGACDHSRGASFTTKLLENREKSRYFSFYWPFFMHINMRFHVRHFGLCCCRRTPVVLVPARTDRELCSTPPHDAGRLG